MDYEENMKKLFQAIYKPVAASPEFKDRLLKHLVTEVSAGAEVLAIPLWRQLKLWIPITAILVLATIAYGIWLPLTSVPTVTPPGIAPVTPPVTPPAPSPATPLPSVTATGILEVRVTDAPAEYEVSAIYVTIANLEVHRSGEEADWTMIIEKSKTFELLELEGVEEILGAQEIEVGHYTQIRMDVESVKATIDGKDKDVFLPSGKLKIVVVGSFEIEAEKTTILTLDFDADKSLVFTGSDKIIFKPVIKLIITEED